MHRIDKESKQLSFLERRSVQVTFEALKDDGSGSIYLELSGFTKISAPYLVYCVEGPGPPWLDQKKLKENKNIR